MCQIVKRLKKSLTLIRSLNGRFPPRVLSPLIDAGWRVGRKWEPELLQAFVEKLRITFPPPAVSALTEFGGLNVGGGRSVFFGHVEEHLCASLMATERLLGEPLYPIGWTNIFEDGGLSVLMDRSGRVYVDGATGYDPPRDYRLDLIETNIERFLKRLFSRRRIPEKQSWYYSESDLE
jgi:hypothetical protein